MFWLKCTNSVFLEQIRKIVESGNFIPQGGLHNKKNRDRIPTENPSEVIL
jgi:hypothetical protein